MIYENTMSIDPEDLDQNGQLKPSTVLYLAQEVAGDHAAVLGSSWDDLQKKNLFWAVIRTKAELINRPIGTEIVLKTWPMPTSRTAYPRCVMGYDKEGNLVFKLVSLWVLMDVQTRAMVLPGKSGVEVIGTEYGTEPELPRGLPVTQQAYTLRKIVKKCHLDKNAHMNNTRYMDWVMQQAPAEKVVKSFELCYFNEGRLNDEMELGCTIGTDTLTVNIHRVCTGDSSGKDRIFAAAVHF